MSIINSMLLIQNMALANQMIAIQNINTIRLIRHGCLWIPVPIKEEEKEEENNELISFIGAFSIIGGLSLCVLALMLLLGLIP